MPGAEQPPVSLQSRRQSIVVESSPAPFSTWGAAPGPVSGWEAYQKGAVPPIGSPPWGWAEARRQGECRPQIALDGSRGEGASCRDGRPGLDRGSPTDFNRLAIQRGNFMEIDRRAFIASLGGASAVALMTSEQKADALEALHGRDARRAVDGQQHGTPSIPRSPRSRTAKPSEAGDAHAAAGNIFNASSRDGSPRGPLPKMSDRSRPSSNSSRSASRRPITCYRAPHARSRPACRKRSSSPA